MKVAEVLDKITNAQNVAEAISVAVERSHKIHSDLNFDPDEQLDVCISEIVAQKILGVIGEYIAEYKNRDVL